MASIHEMVAAAGSLEAAEKMALWLIDNRGPEYLLDLELLYALQGKIEQSWEICKLAVDRFPEDDRVAYNFGWHVMLQGGLLEGFTLMNRGRSAKIWGNVPLETVRPIWDGGNLEGQHILYNCEAGFGDEITFVRFAAEIGKRGGRVTVVCSDGLSPLFARIPEVAAVVQRKALPGVYHDCWVPSMLAPVLLGTEFKDLSGEPYLRPAVEYVEKFAGYIRSDKMKVGIRWLGQDGEDYENRIFPRDLLFNAVDQDHVQLYSLQKDHSQDGLPLNVIDLEVVLDSWEDTAGAIANLDLVITSCTSIAHLAGAMGKPVWVVVPVMMYYVWCWPGSKSPWYNSVRLFRQEIYGEWHQPFDAIQRELKLCSAI